MNAFEDLSQFRAPPVVSADLVLIDDVTEISLLPSALSGHRDSRQHPQIIRVDLQAVKTALSQTEDQSWTPKSVYAAANSCISEALLKHAEGAQRFLSADIPSFFLAFCLVEHMRSLGQFPRWIHCVSADQFGETAMLLENPSFSPFVASPDFYLLDDAISDLSIFEKHVAGEKLKPLDANLESLADILDRLTQLTPAKIIQGPGNNAGQPAQLARALRADGVGAVSASISLSNKFGYKPDYNLPELSDRSRSAFFKWALHNFDLFHYHARPYFWHFQEGAFLPPTAMDMVIAKSMRKNIVFSFRGGEARDHGTFAQHSPFAWSKDEDYADFLSDENKQRYVNLISELADVVTVTDPELQTYVPGSHILPRSIDCGEWSNKGPVRHSNPLVLHAPSRRGVKGTEYVLQAVDALKDRGLQFEFKLVEGLSNQEARKLYETADIVIDQLRIGWYGVLAVEAMALGKTVISYVRDDLTDFFGRERPLLVANPLTISSVLEEAVKSSSLRKKMSTAARTFCERYHHYESVSKIAQGFYKQAQRAPGPNTMDRMLSLYSDMGQQLSQSITTNTKILRDNTTLKKRLKAEQGAKDAILKAQESAKGFAPPPAFREALQSLCRSARDLETALSSAGPASTASPALQSNAGSAIVKGSLVLATPDAIQGWALDDASKSTPVRVRLYYRNEVITEVLADQRGVQSEYPDALNCGFQIKLPKYFSDGKARKIILKAGAMDTVLKGTPCLIGAN